MALEHRHDRPSLRQLGGDGVAQRQERHPAGTQHTFPVRLRHPAAVLRLFSWRDAITETARLRPGHPARWPSEPGWGRARGLLRLGWSGPSGLASFGQLDAQESFCLAAAVAMKKISRFR